MRNEQKIVVGDRPWLCLLPNIEDPGRNFVPYWYQIEAIEPFFDRSTEGAWDKVDAGDQFFFRYLSAEGSDDILERIPDEPNCWRFCWGDHVIGEVFLTKAPDPSQITAKEKAEFREMWDKYLADVRKFDGVEEEDDD